MYKVRTLKSNILIKRERFPEIVKRLKRYLLGDLDAQSSTSIFFLARKFGWQPRIDLNTGNIISLQFYEDSWSRDANNALFVMCKYIEPGGTIHIANDKDQRYWAYKFDGQWFSKTTLTRVFVDLHSKDEVAVLFEKAVEAAIKNGLTRKEMSDTINKNIVSEYLDL